MTESTVIEKAKKYLVRLKNGKQIKKSELSDLKIVIEELDSISYKIKEWKELENEIRKI
ncbi:MAG: hypothetical protein IJV15_00110 [Lachnospiraceae bacterium]|nr:hypothetical protein [Lachnospiraceae bacterium]